MLFNEKYKNSPSFGKDGILRKDVKNFCIVCERPTEYVHVDSENYICSDECLNKFNTAFPHAANVL